MRRMLIILEAALIGAVTGFGFIALWHDWKVDQGPAAVIEKFEINPIQAPSSPGDRI
ncbi:MAG TPA: hypothetical protein VEK34_03655 [Methylocella sp.]|nr:hypothetical protein [Methylocella sp.]